LASGWPTFGAIATVSNHLRLLPQCLRPSLFRSLHQPVGSSPHHFVPFTLFPISPLFATSTFFPLFLLPSTSIPFLTSLLLSFPSLHLSQSLRTGGPERSSNQLLLGRTLSGRPRGEDAPVAPSHRFDGNIPDGRLNASPSPSGSSVIEFHHHYRLPPGM
jgi:hypothetical protein